MIARLTRRRSQALRGQVGGRGIWGQAQPLVGTAEGLGIKVPLVGLCSLALSGVAERSFGAGHLSDFGDSSLLSSSLCQGLRLPGRGCRGTLRDGDQRRGRGRPATCLWARGGLRGWAAGRGESQSPSCR